MMKIKKEADGEEPRMGQRKQSKYQIGLAEGSTRRLESGKRLLPSIEPFSPSAWTRLDADGKIQATCF